MPDSFDIRRGRPCPPCPPCRYDRDGDRRNDRHTFFEVIAMKELKSYTIAGIFFVLILGCLSHFFYEWSSNNFIVGLFAPVSESTWEHMKLIFFPMLLYSLVAIPNLKDRYPCITSAYSAGILLGTLLIPVIYYTYTGILGYHLLALDIGTFALSVILAFAAAYRLTLTCRVKNYSGLLCGVVFLILISFIVFTCYPAQIGLFLAPAST